MLQAFKIEYELLNEGNEVHHYDQYHQSQQYQPWQPQRPAHHGPVYPDCSGDLADIDSGDDKHADTVGGALPPAFRSPRLPLPLPRNRIVIGGHDHETPL